MREMLEERLARFEELERQMMDPDVMTSAGRMAAVAREHGSLAKLATKYRAFKKVTDEIAELRQMVKSHDAEEREMAEEELPVLIERRERHLERPAGHDDRRRGRQSSALCDGDSRRHGR